MKKFILLPIAGILLAAIIVASYLASTWFVFITVNLHGLSVTEAVATGQGDDLARQIQAEGTVLVRNELVNGVPALPLAVNPMPTGHVDAEATRGSWDRYPIAVFGWGATDYGIILGGSGSGAATQTLQKYELTTLRRALNMGGFDYYEPVMNMMTDFTAGVTTTVGGVNTVRRGTPVHMSTGDVPWHNGFWQLYEPTEAMYQPHMAGARAFSDTAMVVISRLAGEGVDLPRLQHRWSGSGDPGSVANAITDETRHYLQLTPEEEDLLGLVAAQNFDRVIVMLNTATNMETGFLEYEEFGIDAAFITGFMGQHAALSVADILRGQQTIYERNTNADGSYVTNNDGDYVYSITEREFSPSGRTAMTHIRRLSDGPTYANSGRMGIRPYEGYTIAGGPFGQNFIDYMEGIYSGYWFFETARYENARGNFANWNYDQIVQFPLGFGLSYTTFSWSIASNHIHGDDLDGNVTADAPYILASPAVAGTTLTNADRYSAITVAVEVTNTGTRYGSEVVQAYFNAPFLGGIERPYIRLATFARTGLLAPGESQLVFLTFNLYNVASYDFLDSNNNGFAGWEFDPGVHNVRIQSNARFIAGETGSGVTLAGGSAVIPFTVGPDGIRYNQNRERTREIMILNPDYTGAEGQERVIGTGRYETRVLEYARNRFTGATAFAGVPIDGNFEGGTPQNFMTRTNFAGTFPRNPNPIRARVDGTPGNSVITNHNFYEARFRLPDATMPTQGVAGPHRLFTQDENEIYQPNTELQMILGSNFYDPLWDEVLNQMSIWDLDTITTQAGFMTAEIESIGKRELLDLDGPSGLNQNMLGGSDINFTAFPVSFVMGQTWNRNLAWEYGVAIAGEALPLGIGGWYAPGANIQRGPFSGRNFEYYSESPILSGVMAAQSVLGATQGGLRAYLKHWVANDGEDRRYALNTWLTEQALREIYLKPFEFSVRYGNGNALMSSFNRLGAVFTGTNGALNIDILRGEWGFRGSIITDWMHAGFMNRTGLLALNGNDLWLGNGYAAAQGRHPAAWRDSAEGVTALRAAAHNILFTLTETYYISQISDVENSPFGAPATLNFPWWTIWGLMPILMVLAAGMFICIFFALKKEIKQFIAFIKRSIKKEPAVATASAGNSAPTAGSDSVESVAPAADATMSADSNDSSSS